MSLITNERAERENRSKPSSSRFWESSVPAHLRIALASLLFLIPVPDASGEFPKPDDALAKPSEIEFLTAISTQIDGLKSEQIAPYHAHLALPSGALPSRIRTAKDLLEHHWAEIAPQALLEAVATGKALASNEAQGSALRGLLDHDIETAIRYYLIIPAYEDFGEHCDFYRHLSAIDPPRAVRLYHESPDQYRTFRNPLEMAFEAWAKQDFPAAWGEATRIDNEKNRRSIFHLLVKIQSPTKPKDLDPLIRSIRNKGDRERLERQLRPEPSETTSPPKAPTPADDKAKLAREEAAIEKLIRDGYAAYDEKKSNDAYHTLQLMMARHPERAWTWLTDMKSGHSYASLYYRDIAQSWPREKLADDTGRLLKGTRSREIEFGQYLGAEWLRHDPESAVPHLFSQHPKHRREWASAMPHHTMVHIKKWNQQQILALMDKIENPESRALARREVHRDFIMRLPRDEGVAAIIALDRKEDIDHIVPYFTSSAAKTQKGRSFTDLILAIDPKHTYVRDQILHRMTEPIRERETADLTAIPDIVRAISDPALRLKAIVPIADYRLPSILAAPLLETLFQLPAGKDRDKAIDGCIDKLSGPDHLALMMKSQNPALRTTLGKNLPTEGWSDEDFARCYEMVRNLPPAWATEEILAKWQSAAAARAPKEKWAETIRDLYGREGASSYFNQKMGEWLKADPKALMDAIEASDTLPNTSVWRMQALLKIHQDDHASTFRQMRARPAEYQPALPTFFSAWREKNGRAATAHSLLVTQEPLRLSIIETMIRFWTQSEPEASAAWVKSLPPGEERKVAIRELIARLSYGTGSYPDWLLPELPTQHPARAKPKSAQTTIPNTKPAPKEESAEKQQEKAKKLAAAREARARTIATIRALAIVDEAEVVANIRKLSKGPHKIDSLLGLLEYATAAGNKKLRQSVISELQATQEIPPAEISEIILKSTPVENLDEALTYEGSLTHKDTRDAAWEIIFTRWSAEKYQPRIQKWIGEIQDPTRRAALTERNLRNLIQRAQADPSLMPDVEPALLQIIITSAREELIYAHLEGRQPDPQTLEAAALSEPEKSAFLRLFDAKQPK